MYLAIILDEKSQNKLKENLSCFSMAGEKACHHCTLAFGAEAILKFILKNKRINRNRKLIVDAIAFNGKVAAFRVVSGAQDSLNKVPHITAIVNRDKGGKPAMSNDLIDWRQINPIELFGTAQMVH